MSDVKPMETAPKLGLPILIRFEGGRELRAQWRGGENGYWDCPGSDQSTPIVGWRFSE